MNDASHPTDPPHFPGMDPIAWAALSDDAGCQVAVIDELGTIRWANAALLGSGEPGQPAPRTIHDVFAPALAQERLVYLRDVLASQRSVAIDGMVRGQRVRTTFRPMPADESGRQCALMVCRQAPSSPAKAGAASDDAKEQAAGAAAEAKNNDRGKLSSLTPREMEVLSLIGMGLSTAQVAKVLHRSAKTVEWHRVSLGNKLGVSNRVELARIAIRAGLSSLDDVIDVDAESNAT
ncbi:MAG: LuxR C-terminal-related transcriptional regulator [Planctomycetota bacterium]